jgi:hypothetical protein
VCFKSKADVDRCRGGALSTAVWAAANKGHSRVLEMLLDCMADVEASLTFSPSLYHCSTNFELSATYATDLTCSIASFILHSDLFLEVR